MKGHPTTRKLVPVVSVLLVLTLLIAACGGAATPTPVPTTPPPAAAPEPAAPAAPSEPTMVDMGSLVFFSTQFVPVEEAEKFRAILAGGGFDFTGSEEGPMLDLVTAEALARERYSFEAVTPLIDGLLQGLAQ